jgi:hypothetical protein
VNVDDPYIHRCIEFFGAKFGLGVFRRGVSTMIVKGVPSFQLNEINGLKGSP